MIKEPAPDSELPTFERKDIEFDVHGIKLQGLLVKAAGDNNPAVLILGGGANIPHKEGYYPAWQEQMAKLGLDSLSFDFRGVGTSEGQLAETTLETRLEDARAASKILGVSNLYIAGVSMGAPLAIRLANELNAVGVILISPAAYSAEARTKHFGPEFSEAIRKPNSWESSPDFGELERFQGRVIFAYGRKDDVIPMPVLERYGGIVEGKGGAPLSFEGVGHRFMRESDPASVRAREVLYSLLSELGSN